MCRAGAACPPGWAGWDTPQVTSECSPAVVPGWEWAEPGLSSVWGLLVPAQMFINTSLVTAMLREKLSQGWDVLLGEMQAVGAFLPLHREGGAGIGSGVGGLGGQRSWKRINQFGIRRWHWQPAM